MAHRDQRPSYGHPVLSLDLVGNEMERRFLEARLYEMELLQ
jgi:hypothetical protein